MPSQVQRPLRITRAMRKFSGTTLPERALTAYNEVMGGVKRRNYYRVARKRQTMCQVLWHCQQYNGTCKNTAPFKTSMIPHCRSSEGLCSLLLTVCRKKRILSAPDRTRHQALRGVLCHLAPREVSWHPFIFAAFTVAYHLTYVAFSNHPGFGGEQRSIAIRTA